MARMIINYDSCIPAENVPYYIQAVVNGGRISKSKNGKCYCFLTEFKDGTMCYSEIAEKGTDTFRLYRKD